MAIWPPTNGKDLTSGHEGKRYAAYYDQMGFPTQGIGHKLSNERLEPLTRFPPVTDVQIAAWFADDYAAAQQAARAIFAGWNSFSDARQAALTDMAFELGGHGLREFQHMIDAANAGDWTTAAAQAKASLWDRQVPKRAARVEALLASGEWAALDQIDPKYRG